MLYHMHYFLPASLIAIGDGPAILPGGTLNPPTSVHLAKQVQDMKAPHSDPSHQDGASNLPAAGQMDHSKSRESSSHLAADETGHSQSSGLPLLATDQMDQSNSHKSSGGSLLAADKMNHSKSSGPHLLAADQMDRSKWSSGHSLTMGHHNVNRSIDECSFLQTSRSATPIEDLTDHSIDPLCIGGHPLTMGDRAVDIKSYSFSGGRPFIISSLGRGKSSKRMKSRGGGGWGLLWALPTAF